MTETVTENELLGLKSLVAKTGDMVEKAKLLKELEEKEHQYNIQYEERLRELENERYHLGSK